MLRFISLALAGVLALALTGCQSSAPADGRIQVVSSINVWGNIADTIGGDAVDVTNVIDTDSQDPHEFSAGAADLAHVARADVVIVNGAGYDPYMEQLIDSAKPTAVIVTVADLAHTGIENEHYWYDLPTVRNVAEKLADVFAHADPVHADRFSQTTGAFTDGVQQLQQRLDASNAAHPGRTALLTEPLPYYLLATAGYRDVTPSGLTLAVETGSEIPLGALREAESIVSSGQLTLLAENQQTDSTQVRALTDTAQSANVPVMSFSELLPAKLSYLDWMGAYVRQVEALQ